MPSPSRNQKRSTYFSRQNYRQSQRQRDHSQNLDEALVRAINSMHLEQEQNENLDNALAHAINSMHLDEVVPREWYERLWGDFRIIDEDREVVRARWKGTLIGLLILLIIALTCFLYKLLSF